MAIEMFREDRPCNGHYERAACVFGVRDLSLLTSLPHFFAHKFRSNFQPATLQCLREWHCNRTMALGLDLDWIRYGTLPAVRYQYASDKAPFIC